ncbi:MAG: alpha/beta fold hydrolase [Anaerolineae bacterium]|nr:alpha/beta fold hydrolase [Anaerolineae bacterium]
MKKFLILILVLAITGAAQAQETTPEATPEVTPESTGETTPPARRISAPGYYTVRANSGGVSRSFLLSVPISYFNGEGAAPVVFALHGAGGDGANYETYAGWGDLSESQRIVMVYPDGVDGQWNDGRPGALYDDAAYIRGIVDALDEILRVDLDRVYATGYSMGGMMALRLACLLPDYFAGAASIASTMPQYIVSDCDGTAPKPVIFLVGTDDFVIPWMGVRNAYLDAMGSASYWSEHNDCQFIGPQDALPDEDVGDGTRVIRQNFSNCEDGASVAFYGIFGGGHTVPGSEFPGAFAAGAVSHDIHAAAEIWAFFESVQSRD